MKRSTDRILTTHAGRIPNPSNMAEVQQAKASGDQPKIDEVVTTGIIESIKRQVDLKNDIHSDGEFWKGRDEAYFSSRTTGVESQPTWKASSRASSSAMATRHRHLHSIHVPGPFPLTLPTAMGTHRAISH